jgi:hypothetical protein
MEGKNYMKAHVRDLHGMHSMKQGGLHAPFPPLPVQDGEQCRQLAERQHRRREELQHGISDERKRATVRAQALVTTLKVMHGADR